MKKIIPALGLFMMLLTLQEILVRMDFVSASLLPAPSDIAKTLIELREDFTEAFLSTFINVLWGLFGSILLGGLLALGLSLSEFLRRAILPFAVFFQTVPIIAIAPLLVIYLGFGAPTVIASSLIVSIFPILANTLIGLESPTQGQRELFKIYGARPWEVLWHLKIPSAVTSIYSGLKVSAGLAIIGAIAGEFVAGGGLGALIDSARTQQRVDIVFAALLLLSLMGLVFMGALAAGYSLLQQKRPYASGRHR